MNKFKILEFPESKIKKYIYKQLLKELDSIGEIERQIKIVFDPLMSVHAVERQLRHLDEPSGEIIREKDIKELIQLAIPYITDDLIQNNIDVNRDELILINTKNDLNVVVVLKPSNKQNQLDCIIKTTMIEKNFKIRSHNVIYKF